jgi:FMN phosphatase YigB (HAD superfamily)
MTKAIIFDMTETIHTLNKDKMYAEFKSRIWQKHFSTSSFEEFKTAYFRAYSRYQVGLITNDIDFFKFIESQLNKPLTEQERTEMIKEHADSRVHFIEIMPGLIDTLEYLKPKYKLAMVSNCVKNWAEEDFKRMGFNPSKYFDADIASQTTGFLKPNPRSYLLALEKLGIPPEEAAYIGDDVLDLNGAYFAGLKTLVLFKKPTQVGHYTEYLSEGKLRPKQVHHEIDKLSELKALF